MVTKVRIVVSCDRGRGDCHKSACVDKSRLCISVCGEAPGEGAISTNLYSPSKRTMIDEGGPPTPVPLPPPSPLLAHMYSALDGGRDMNVLRTWYCPAKPNLRTWYCPDKTNLRTWYAQLINPWPSVLPACIHTYAYTYRPTRGSSLASERVCVCIA